MKIRFCLIFLLASYVALIFPFSEYLKNRPVVVKLGFMPEAEAMKMVCGDQKNLVAQYSVVKVLFYFGTLAEKWSKKVKLPPEYFNMFKTLETSVKLDPYNSDAYYFSQAAFTWEVGKVGDVNRLLLYGMKYRTWDYSLPFYTGFNYAYFLKDYKKAAIYMQKAAELSSDPLFTTLASRYFYEAGQENLGIIFLDTMEKGAKDKNIKSVYELRKRALLAVKVINEAVTKFGTFHHRPPRDLSEVIAAGIIGNIPDDPYGGRFYLGEDGMVRSTSKFAQGVANK